MKSGENWAAGRSDLTIAGAVRWLRAVLTEGRSDPVGSLPRASASFRMASAPLIVRPGNKSLASRYVLNTVRPAIGYFFPAIGEADLRLPQWWPTNDGTVVPWFTPLGIDVPTVADAERIGRPATPGLLLGRVARTAWINSVRYDRDRDRFVVGIWVEPRRADFHDLVLDVREYADGELSFSARTPLADIRLPARARGRLWFNLPTLGRGLEREVSLYDRDGTLLDHHERFAMIERIDVGLQANGSVTSFSTGDTRQPAALSERLDAFDLTEVEYRELLKSGMRRRVVETRPSAVAYIRRRLRRAAKGISILDPYFGNDVTDWELLAGVPAPVRILRNSQRVAPPPAITNVEVRRFTARGRPVPFHDRFYLWPEGGLSVGTSPNGFGNRVFRIDEVDRLEREVWQALFDRWWSSGDFTV